MDTTDRATDIRAKLKTYGYTSRDVSVKSDYYSMGSSIRIKIKNPKVPSALVKLVAEAHEDISRDQFGDILSGGNRFVFVSYTSEAEAALAAPYLAAVKAALAELALGDDSRLIDIEGVPNARVGLYRGHMPSLWGPDGFITSAGGPEGVAFTIGEMIANG